MLPDFALARPTTVEEAVSLLGEDRLAYCGGTELLLAMRAGLQRPAVLVDLKRVPGLQGVRREHDEVVIGAATTHDGVAGDPLVQRRLPVLAAVERRVGNARVRAAGSVGGNLCFAEPRSDLATLLVALGADVTLQGPSGTRTVQVADLIVGAYYADKEPDELMVDVRVPVAVPVRAGYRKLQVTERPSAGVAVVEDVESGRCRVVVGAVGEVPHLHEADDLDAVDPAEVVRDLDPVADLTGSADYKRHVVAVLVRRVVEDVRSSRG